MDNTTQTPEPNSFAFPSLTSSASGLVLRPLIATDIPAVTEYGADSLIQTWLPLPNPYTEKNARWFCLEFGPRQQATGQGLVFGIQSQGRLAGVIDLKRTDWQARTTELGYWAAPWARGRGIIREAVSSLTRWVLESQGFSRVELRAATGNIASQRVAEAAGFTREGVQRNAGFVHAGRVDLIVYSFIDSDLPEPAGIPGYRS